MKVTRVIKETVPRLPNERDESTDSTSNVTRDPRMDKAVEDALSDKVPTDKSAEMDPTHRKNLRDEVPGAERDTVSTEL